MSREIRCALIAGSLCAPAAPIDRYLRRIGSAGASAFMLLLAVGLPASAQCNADPVAVADAVAYSGGPVLVVDVLANDVEADGEALALTPLSTTCTGILGQDFGLLTLIVTGFSGPCTINYRITDESGGTDTATVTVSDGTAVFADGFESGDTSKWAGATGRIGR